MEWDGPHQVQPRYTGAHRLRQCWRCALFVRLPGGLFGWHLERTHWRLR